MQSRANGFFPGCYAARMAKKKPRRVPRPQPSADDLLTIPAAAELVGLHRVYLARLVAKGRGPVVHRVIAATNGRPVNVVRRGDLLAWAADKPRPAGGPRTHTSCPLGEQIERLGAARGLTLPAIAERVGLSRAGMNDIRRGRFSPRLDTLDRIAEVLGVTISALLEGQGKTRRTTAMERHPEGRPRTVTLSPLGERIEGMAARRGLTRDQLAKTAGLSATGLWSILTGRTSPKLATAAKLSAALGVPVKSFID